ncbi:OmpP1/FadL family transporter [Flammeovirga sp. SJP92]|uniref:OmpP1/FadL family transporter n=1 Tax=Flammeovirga sp. SJP92 TaxID=1775430 RepID=UPI0007870C3E|nr:OmpP1/FadL family transporter [Flammeovirga sp. SJP92]KXX68593.1 hypothetical protein AVL50_22805 [Flammeovirga sp. SJP92]
MKLRNLLLSLAAVCIAQASFANGFQVLLQGTKQTGRGNVGVGYGPDASSLFFNPGALSFLESTQIQVGFSPVMSHISYRGLEGTQKYESNSPMGTPFHAYGVYRPSAESPWAFGLGVFTPFGSTVTYDHDWTGRYSLQEISLQSIYIQPTVSYRIGEKVSVGAGLDIVSGSVVFQKSNTAPGGDINSKIEGNTLQYAFNVGVFAQLNDQLSLGVNYRSGVDMKVEGGDATFNVPNAYIAGVLGMVEGVNTDKFDATLPLPQTIAVGVGYKVTDKLALALDFNYVGWSVYESLEVEFEEFSSNNISFARNWKDSYIINFGAEYQALDNLVVRAGAYYDTTPVRDGYMTPESPDANTIGLTIGASYNIGEHFAIDAAFLYNTKEQRENVIPDGVNTGALNGVYKASAMIPSIALNYKF